jgi:hypothetical protein
MAKGIIYKDGKPIGEVDTDSDEYRGLGDLLHSVLHPAAKIIDGAIGTDLSNCKGCEDRREKLNDKFPIR